MVGFNEDFFIDEDLLLEEELEATGLKNKDRITGRIKKEDSKSKLNKKKLSKYEMDELFLDY